MQKAKRGAESPEARPSTKKGRTNEKEPEAEQDSGSDGGGSDDSSNVPEAERPKARSLYCDECKELITFDLGAQCETCRLALHLACLKPVRARPLRGWHCPNCVATMGAAKAKEVASAPVPPKRRAAKKDSDNEDDENEAEAEEEEESSEEVPSHCTKCGSDQHPGKLLLCDGVKCENAFHIYCLTPKLEKIPRGKWYCPKCTTSRANSPQPKGADKRKKVAREEIEEEEDAIDTQKEVKAKDNDDTTRRKAKATNEKKKEPAKKKKIPTKPKAKRKKEDDEENDNNEASDEEKESEEAADGDVELNCEDEAEDDEGESAVEEDDRLLPKKRGPKSKALPMQSSDNKSESSEEDAEAGHQAPKEKLKNSGIEAEGKDAQEILSQFKQVAQSGNIQMSVAAHMALDDILHSMKPAAAAAVAAVTAPADGAALSTSVPLAPLDKIASGDVMTTFSRPLGTSLEKITVPNGSTTGILDSKEKTLLVWSGGVALDGQYLTAVNAYGKGAEAKRDCVKWLPTSDSALQFRRSVQLTEAVEGTPELLFSLLPDKDQAAYERSVTLLSPAPNNPAPYARSDHRNGKVVLLLSQALLPAAWGAPPLGTAGKLLFALFAPRRPSLPTVVPPPSLAQQQQHQQCTPFLVKTLWAKDKRIAFIGFSRADIERYNTLISFLSRSGAVIAVPVDSLQPAADVIVIHPPFLPRLNEVPGVLASKQGNSLFLRGPQHLEMCATQRVWLPPPLPQVLFPQGTLLVLPNSDALLSSDTAPTDLISMLQNAKAGAIDCVLKLHAETLETISSLKITSLRAKKCAELLAKPDPIVSRVTEEEESRSMSSLSHQLPVLFRTALKMVFLHSTNFRHVVLLTGEPELQGLARSHQLHACDLNELRELLKRVPSRPIGKAS